MEKNRGAVLRTKVRALAIYLRGIVSLPEHIEQLFERHFSGIKGDLHHFGMPGLVGADIFICWVDGVAVRIAHCGIDYARNLAKRFFDSPEASSTKGCNFVHFTLRGPKHRAKTSGMASS